MGKTTPRLEREQIMLGVFKTKTPGGLPGSSNMWHEISQRDYVGRIRNPGKLPDTWSGVWQ